MDFQKTKKFKCSDLFPEDFSVQISVADWYFAKGMLPESLENYKAAEVADPNNSNVQSKLGQIYLTKKQNKKARNAFERAIKLNPNDSKSHYQPVSVAVLG